MVDAQKTKAVLPSATFARPVQLKDLGIQESDLCKVSLKGFATCIRVLRQNWRQGTVSCKGRSDVSRSNKKPWKQKGTGRARAGSARSPLWRGGGVIFGPQKRERVLKVPKELKKGVFRSLLLEFLNEGRILTVDWSVAENRPKTAHAASLLKQCGIDNQKIVLMVASDNMLTAASFSNIPNVHVMSFDEPNVFDLANTQWWIVLKQDEDLLKQMVSRWN